MTPPPDVLATFGMPAESVVRPVRGGLIHESHQVAHSGRALLLQRFAAHVFPDAALVARNIRRVSAELLASYDSEATARSARAVLRPIDTVHGQLYAVDADGTLWRAAHWIDDAVTHQVATCPERLYQAACAFADFQQRLAHLAQTLPSALPGFHDTRQRQRQFEAAVRTDRAGRAAGCRAEITALVGHAPLALTLVERALPLCVVHNDAKLSNLLFDRQSDAPLAIVDLDTTGPGIGLTDLGDLLRSSASAADEESDHADDVSARPAWLEAAITGWCDTLGDRISPAERAVLPLAGAVLTYEQALRFLTDHLEGDRYYTVDRPERNLMRCRTQLALLHSMLAQRDALQRLVGRS